MSAALSSKFDDANRCDAGGGTWRDLLAFMTPFSLSPITVTAN